MRSGGSTRPCIEAHFIGVLLNGGHLEEAAGYLSDPIPGREYPFPSADAVISRCADADRRRILRAAVRAWRDGSPRSPDFFRFFSEHWRLLPPEEAADIVRDAVELILREPDMPIDASGPDFEFRSWRQFLLFEILGPLRYFDPDRVESLIGNYPELGAATARFPSGMESVMAEANRRSRECALSGPGKGGGFIAFGSGPDDIAKVIAMAKAEREGDTTLHFEEALRLFREDTGPAQPNRAPREFRPSAQAWRHALYVEGKIRGREALAALERVPDRDLRLFARIELAAALAGLHEWRSHSRIRKWGQTR